MDEVDENYALMLILQQSVDCRSEQPSYIAHGVTQSYGNAYLEIGGRQDGLHGSGSSKQLTIMGLHYHAVAPQRKVSESPASITEYITEFQPSHSGFVVMASPLVVQ